MFSLIVSIISIALVAVLAAASIYYGGDAFTKGSAKALASTVVTQAQQISSAHTLYKNDEGGTPANDLQDLVDGDYLASVPAAPAKVVVADTDEGTAGAQPSEWELNADTVTLLVDNEEVCKLINEQGSGAEDSAAYDPDATGAAQFGCNNAAGVMTFTYKG